MRILHIIRSINPQDGGPIEAIKTIAAAHLAQGREVEVAALDSPECEWGGAFPLPLHLFGPSLGKYGYTPRLIPWLKKEASRFDAVVVNGIWQFSGYGTYKALQQTVHGYYLFPHGMLDPWFQEHYKLKHLKKLTYWWLAERHVLRAAKVVFFTSEEERRRASHSFPGYRAKERVVPYAASEPPSNLFALKNSFLEQNPHLASKKVVLFLGRVDSKKGVDLLIKGFASFLRQNREDYHLLIAGPVRDPKYLASLQDLACKSGIQRQITWSGMLDRKRKWGALAAADVFILPSHQENFGVAVAEALASGLPVLISNKVNIWPEVIQDGAGFVADDTCSGVVDLLSKWHAYDAKEKMRLAAQQCYQKRYHPEHAANEMARIFLEPSVVTGSRPLHHEQSAAI